MFLPLCQFVDVVKRAAIPNFLVVALDQRTVDFLKKRGTQHRTVRSPRDGRLLLAQLDGG